MGLTVAEKIIKAHLVKGEMKTGKEIAIKIDQTLTQDSTGTMAYLQFEALGVDRVKTKKSIAYIDHNMLQSGPENVPILRKILTIVCLSATLRVHSQASWRVALTASAKTKALMAYIILRMCRRTSVIWISNPAMRPTR